MPMCRYGFIAPPDMPRWNRPCKYGLWVILANRAAVTGLVIPASRHLCAPVAENPRSRHKVASPNENPLSRHAVAWSAE